MSHVIKRTNTKTPKAQNTGSNFIQNNLFTFFATLSGVVIGVLASLAMVAPAIQSEVASATTQATKNLSANLASDVQPNSCSLNSGTGTNAAQTHAAVTTAATTMPEAGGRGGDQPSGNGGGTWIEKWVGNQRTETNATISDTGPDSHNSVSTVNKNTTKIENKNDITVTNSNSQSASSGSATVSNNTNAGSAASGQSVNSNDSSTSVSVNN